MEPFLLAVRLLQFLHAMYGGAKTNDPLQKLLFGKRVKESRKVRTERRGTKRRRRRREMSNFFVGVWEVGGGGGE